MNTFKQTILVCSIAAIVFILIFAFTTNEISMAGMILFVSSPILFVIGCIVALAGNKGSNTRQAGQGIMLSSLLYILIGYASCTAGFVRL